MKRFLIILSILISLVTTVLLLGQDKPDADQQISASFLGPQGVSEGFEYVDGTKQLNFPEDFGPHPSYQTEWWYYTGNLESEDGNRFGYQLTFFRRGLLPPQDWVERESDWATNQVFMAHFAISDVEQRNHQAYEQFSRGSFGLAGATSNPFSVWVEDWRVEQSGKDQYSLIVSENEISLNLTLSDTKGPILHGESGYSRKGPGIGNASYYFSQTRLASAGEIQIGDATYGVQGLSWMDHEFSTSALSAGQVGWDWFSIQLEEGSELMVFQIRRDDGTIDPFSSGTYVAENGDTHDISWGEFEILVVDTWRSPDTGAVYPSQWQLRIPSQNLELNIEPLLADQEVALSYIYWEGAVQINGLKAGIPISGLGFVEMTGYVQSMEGEF